MCGNNMHLCCIRIAYVDFGNVANISESQRDVRIQNPLLNQRGKAFSQNRAVEPE